MLAGLVQILRLLVALTEAILFFPQLLLWVAVAVAAAAKSRPPAVRVVAAHRTPTFLVLPVRVPLVRDLLAGLAVVLDKLAAAVAAREPSVARHQQMAEMVGEVFLRQLLERRLVARAAAVAVMTVRQLTAVGTLELTAGQAQKTGQPPLAVAEVAQPGTTALAVGTAVPEWSSSRSQLQQQPHSLAV